MEQSRTHRASHRTRLASGSPRVAFDHQLQRVALSCVFQTKNKRRHTVCWSRSASAAVGERTTARASAVAKLHGPTGRGSIKYPREANFWFPSADYRYGLTQPAAGGIKT